MKHPRRPTTKGVERHIMTRLPFRRWCPACVAGRLASRNRMPSAAQRQYWFLGPEGEAPTMVVLAARGRRARSLFGQVVPRKRPGPCPWAQELARDILTSGAHEVILKCESAEPTVLEDSGVGDSQADGATVKVQALGEHAQVVKAGLVSVETDINEISGFWRGGPGSEQHRSKHTDVKPTTGRRLTGLHPNRP